MKYISEVFVAYRNMLLEIEQQGRCHDGSSFCG